MAVKPRDRRARLTLDSPRVRLCAAPLPRPHACRPRPWCAPTGAAGSATKLSHATSGCGAGCSTQPGPTRAPQSAADLTSFRCAAGASRPHTDPTWLAAACKSQIMYLLWPGVQTPLCWLATSGLAWFGCAVVVPPPRWALDCKRKQGDAGARPRRGRRPKRPRQNADLRASALFVCSAVQTPVAGRPE